MAAIGGDGRESRPRQCGIKVEGRRVNGIVVEETAWRRREAPIRPPRHSRAEGAQITRRALSSVALSTRVSLAPFQGKLRGEIRVRGIQQFTARGPSAKIIGAIVDVPGVLLIARAESYRKVAAERQVDRALRVDR